LEEFETFLVNQEPFWCYHENIFKKWRRDYLCKLQVCRRATVFTILQLGTKSHFLTIMF